PHYCNEGERSYHSRSCAQYGTQYWQKPLVLTLTTVFIHLLRSWNLVLYDYSSLTNLKSFLIISYGKYID
ncbi:MAG: hypothetical protein WA323_18075, partial [Candidatus Nitrosopolaris sp.]